MLEELLKDRNKTLYHKEDEQPAKKVKLFDILNQVFTKSTKHIYNKKIASGYLLSMFLSHVDDLIEEVQEINKRQFYIPDEKVYQYYFTVIEQGRYNLNYIKAKKLIMDDELEDIMLTYQVSKNEALMIKNHKEKING